MRTHIHIYLYLDIDIEVYINKIHFLKQTTASSRGRNVGPGLQDYETGNNKYFIYTHMQNNQQSPTTFSVHITYRIHQVSR